jgi:predicted CXXCH cytochrome family protein
MPIDEKRAFPSPRTTLLLILLLFCALHPAWNASAGPAPVAAPILITSPPDRSAVEGALVGLSVRVAAKSVDELQVFVNGSKVPVPKRNYSSFDVCFDGIPLSYGNNEIKVVAFMQRQKVAEARSRVFFRSDLSSGAAAAPDGFNKYLFHQYDNEKGCTPCHKLDFSAFTDAETKPELSPCYQCHKKLLSNYRSVHGPAAVWSCLSCHDKKGTPKLAVSKPESKVCFGCHENVWEKMKFGHGPTAAGDCATCHDPHASDNPFFLRVPARDLCLGCHEEILTRPHAIMGFSNSGHPVRKPVDPFHPGKEFTCVSCHNPHAGSSWVFLQNYDGATEIFTFCQTCHKM